MLLLRLTRINLSNESLSAADINYQVWKYDAFCSVCAAQYVCDWHVSDPIYVILNSRPPFFPNAINWIVSFVTLSMSRTTLFGQRNPIRKFRRRIGANWLQIKKRAILNNRIKTILKLFACNKQRKKKKLQLCVCEFHHSILLTEYMCKLWLRRKLQKNLYIGDSMPKLFSARTCNSHSVCKIAIVLKLHGEKKKRS